MTAELSPLDIGAPVRMRDSRRAARQMTRYDLQAQTRIAQTAAEADVALAKLHAGDVLVGNAALGLANHARLSQSLELQAPEASAALAGLRVTHEYMVNQVIVDFANRVHRI